MRVNGVVVYPLKPTQKKKALLNEKKNALNLSFQGRGAESKKHSSRFLFPFITATFLGGLGLGTPVKAQAPNTPGALVASETKSQEDLTKERAAVVKKISDLGYTYPANEGGILELKSLGEQFTNVLRQSESVPLDEMEKSVQVAIHKLNNSQFTNNPQIAELGEQAILSVLDIHDLLIGHLKKMTPNTEVEQKKVDEYIQRLSTDLLWSENHKREKINDKVASIYAKWFTDSLISKLYQYKGQYYSQMGHPISQKILSQALKGPQKQKLTEELKRQLAALDQENLPKNERDTVLDKTFGMHNFLLNSVYDGHKVVNDENNAFEKWFIQEFDTPVFKRYISQSIFMYDYHHQDEESANYAATQRKNLINSFLYNILDRRPDLTPSYVNSLNQGVQDSKNDEARRIYFYRSLAQIPNNPQSMAITKEFLTRQLVSETSQNAVKDGLAPALGAYFLRDFIATSKEADALGGYENVYPQKKLDLERVRQILTHKNTNTDVANRPLPPMVSLMMDIFNHANGELWNPFVPRLQKPPGQKITPQEREEHANAIERARRNSFLISGSLIRQLYEAMPIDEIEERGTSKIFKHLLEQGYLSQHLMNQEVSVSGAHEALFRDMFKDLQSVGDLQLTEMGQLKGWITSEEMLSDMMVELMRDHLSKYSTLDKANDHFKAEMKQLGQKFPGIGFKGGRGVYVNVYENVRDALYSAVHHNIPPYYKEKDETLDTLARQFAETSQKVFTHELLLKLWGAKPEERPIESFRGVTNIGMQRTLLAILRDLRLDEVYLRYQFEESLLKKKQPFRETVEGWKQSAKQEQSKLLKQINTILWNNRTTKANSAPS